MRGLKLIISALLIILPTFIQISIVSGEIDRVLVFNIDGTIDAGYSDLLSRRLLNVLPNQPVIIVLKTNGGYLKPTQDIVYSIINSPGNITVYIPPGGYAYSAGAYIAISSDILAMAPGSVLGSAEPRDITGGSDPKVINAMAEWIASIAEARDRNKTAAELMVRENLDFTAGEALKNNIADILAEDLSELLNILKWDEYKVVEVKRDARSQILSLLSNPLLAGILLDLAAILILIELIHPTYIGFIVAITILILSFLGLGYLGADATAMVLLLIGISAIIMETWVGQGELATAGAILSAIGIVMLYRSEHFIWTFNYRLFVFGGLIIIVSLVGFLGFYLHKIKEILMKGKSPLDLDLLIGKTGIVKEAIRPGKVGVVLVESDLWSAIADEEIGEGERIRVVGIEGVILKVEKLRTK